MLGGTGLHFTASQSRPPEAESNVADAIRECLAVRAELGMPPTVTTREVEVFV